MMCGGLAAAAAVPPNSGADKETVPTRAAADMRRPSRRRCSALPALLIVLFLIDNRASNRGSRIRPWLVGEETPDARPGVSHQEGGVFPFIGDGLRVAAQSSCGGITVARFRD